MTRRERRRQRDAYYDDNVARDGEVVRRPHHLADSNPNHDPKTGEFASGGGGGGGGGGKSVGKTASGNEIRQGAQHGEKLLVGGKEVERVHHEVFSPSGQRLGSVRSAVGAAQTTIPGTKYASGRGEVVRFRAEKTGSTPTWHGKYKEAMKRFDSAEEAPVRFHYGRGYATDAGTGLIADQRSPFQVAQGSVPTKTAEDLPRGQAFPTQSGGTFPAYNNEIGAECTCANGRPGTLKPHPSTSSMLICVENGRDAATIDAASAYYAMRDQMQDEWKRYAPKPFSDSGCGGGARDQDISGSNPPPIPRDYPRGGYGQDPLQHWPDPDNLQSMAEGDLCTINGAPGKLVRRNGQLVCEPRQDMDAQSVRDAAYYQSVRDLENAWRQWR
jgi:hypothetical protein